MPTNDTPPLRVANPHESVMDIGQAIRELGRAQDEMAAVERLGESAKHRRRAMLVEPLGRLELARRFLVQVLERHGWSES